MRTRPVVIFTYMIPYESKGHTQKNLYVTKNMQEPDSWLIMYAGSYIDMLGQQSTRYGPDTRYSDVNEALIHAMRFANKIEDLETRGSTVEGPVLNLNDPETAKLYAKAITALKSVHNTPVDAF